MTLPALMTASSRIHQDKTPLPKGWRWLRWGEWAKTDDVEHDPRAPAPRVILGDLHHKMVPTSWPVRRRLKKKVP